ncbi:hypothetical protein KCU95_g4716, partial [Aureobasidium melanogenum]
MPTSSFAFPWGWVIYRTVYTPESDQLWPRAMDTINTYLACSLQKTLIESGLEEDYETMIAELENYWMDDASLFDQATFENLRTHFTSWLQTQDTEDEEGDKMLPCVRFWTFLVIDETNLKMIADAPDPNGNLVKASAKRAPRDQGSLRSARRTQVARQDQTRTSQWGRWQDISWLAELPHLVSARAVGEGG